MTREFHRYGLDHIQTLIKNIDSLMSPAWQRTLPLGFTPEQFIRGVLTDPEALIFMFRYEDLKMKASGMGAWPVRKYRAHLGSANDCIDDTLVANTCHHVRELVDPFSGVKGTQILGFLAAPAATLTNMFVEDSRSVHIRPNIIVLVSNIADGGEERSRVEGFYYREDYGR